ncbi:hypothetical protein ACFQ7F_13095 [Streptomyces sp. NPDC056486]|uniref:hypothetical protein n=1 Tax=Streptomyces sp. NPDC056486 TaxID=3345835 RepID=UPI0036C79526
MKHDKPVAMTNYFVQGRKAAAVTAAVGVALLGLTACDTGPECVDYSTTMHTTTTIVNGKPVVSTAPVTVCVKYAAPEPTKH